ncbi:caspase family protein [Mesorhizobium australicum]
MTFVETSKPRLFLRAWLTLLVAMLVCVAASMLRPVEAKDLKGVALIVGQSRYEHLAALPNPANDARDMAKMLTDLGFDARNVTDRDASKLKRDLERFVEDAEGADVALVYYSGHGSKPAARIIWSRSMPMLRRSRMPIRHWCRFPTSWTN